jgi:hypothetical protein
MPLTTFLEIADDPGLLDGYGPIAGALARQIARDAAAMYGRTTWRCVVVDDTHQTVLGVAHPVSVPKHDPPPRLADLVSRTHPFCVFPGCRVPARRCDLDHRIPYEPPGDADAKAGVGATSGGGDATSVNRRGGLTCECNLSPLCRTHHRLKTAGLLRYGPEDDAGLEIDAAAEQGRSAGHLHPPGRLVWTTAAGLTYPHTVPPATPPPAPADLRPVLDRLRDDRAAGHRKVGWMNTALRASYWRGRRDEAAQTAEDLRETLLSEVRRQDYAEMLARNPEDAENAPPVPEPPELVPEPPPWLARLPLPPLVEPGSAADVDTQDTPLLLSGCEALLWSA